MERKTQERLIKYLKGKGCYVIKTKPGMGTPVGCPDLFAFLEGFWAAFEVKAGPKSRYKPLQKETIAMLGEWSHVRVVHPENYDEVIAELETIL